MKSVIALFAVAVLIACVSATQTRFKDKIILVTGGSSGIGYQTALQFAQEGGRVIIAARDRNTQFYSVQKAVEAIKNDATVKQNKGEIRGVKADLSTAQDVENLFNDIRKTEGRIDFAVNAAGISGPMGTIGDTAKYIYTPNDPISNNYYATLRAIAEEEALMVEKMIDGVIVNVIDIVGITPGTASPFYAASKYATVGLSNSIALCHIDATQPPYIRSVGVAPGPIGTPLLYNRAKFYYKGQQPWEGDFINNDQSPIWKESVGNFTDSVPMGRIGKTKEVADTILWLCTEDALFISGSTVTVDGGIWAV